MFALRFWLLAVAGPHYNRTVSVFTELPNYDLWRYGLFLLLLAHKLKGICRWCTVNAPEKRVNKNTIFLSGITNKENSECLANIIIESICCWGCNSKPNRIHIGRIANVYAACVECRTSEKKTQPKSTVKCIIKRVNSFFRSWVRYMLTVYYLTSFCCFFRCVLYCV